MKEIWIVIVVDLFSGIPLAYKGFKTEELAKEFVETHPVENNCLNWKIEQKIEKIEFYEK